MLRTLRFLSRNTILIILASLLLFFSIARPETFLSGLNVTNVMRQVSFDSLIVLGQTLVLIGGGIDLSVGSVMAMASALAVGLQPLGVIPACLIALLFGGLIGAVNGFMVTRLRIVPFIATLGTMTVVRGLLLTYTQQQPISGTVEWFSSISNTSLGPIPVPTLILIVIALLVHLLLARTRFGRNLYAAGGNLEACRLAGINADRYKFWAFVICGALAALAGILLASRLNSATIHIGQDTPLLVLTAAILGGASMRGGRGSVPGAMMGIITLAILSNGMNLMGVVNFYQLAIRAILLLVVVVLDAFYTTQLRERMTQSAVGKGGAAVPVGTHT